MTTTPEANGHRWPCSLFYSGNWDDDRPRARCTCTTPDSTPAKTEREGAVEALLNLELDADLESAIRSARADVRCLDCDIRYGERQDYGCFEGGRAHDGFTDSMLAEAEEEARRDEEGREYVTVSVAELRAAIAQDAARSPRPATKAVCSQCGREYAAPACGIGHAMKAHELGIESRSFEEDEAQPAARPATVSEEAVKSAIFRTRLSRYTRWADSDDGGRYVIECPVDELSKVIAFVLSDPTALNTALPLPDTQSAGEGDGPDPDLVRKWTAASEAARAAEHHFPADCLAEAIATYERLTVRRGGPTELEDLITTLRTHSVMTGDGFDRTIGRLVEVAAAPLLTAHPEAEVRAEAVVEAGALRALRQIEDLCVIRTRRVSKAEIRRVAQSVTEGGEHV